MKKVAPISRLSFLKNSILASHHFTNSLKERIDIVDSLETLWESLLTTS